MMTAEEKWDKLRAHVVARKRHLDPPREDEYECGVKAAMVEIAALIHRFDEE
jgi:hypothetical protein